MASNDKRIPLCARFAYGAIAAFADGSGEDPVPAYDDLSDAERAGWEDDARKALEGYTASSIHAERHIGVPGAVHLHKSPQAVQRKTTLFIEAARSLASALGSGEARQQHITVEVEGAQVSAKDAIAAASGGG